jgi:hypothetical protein
MRGMDYFQENDKIVLSVLIALGEVFMEIAHKCKYFLLDRTQAVKMSS